MPKTQAMNATNEANGNYAATPQSNEIHSGVGVLDKTVKILDALESGPATLGQLVSATGLARPTAHRLAIALERHRFVLRDQHGRFVLGSRFAELAAAAGEDRLLTAAAPILQTLLDRMAQTMVAMLRTVFGNRVLGPDKPPVARVQTLFIRKIVLKIETNAPMARARELLVQVQKEMVAEDRFKSLIVYYDVDPM